MRESVQLTINGIPVRVPQGSSVAAAVMQAGHSSFRRSVTGEARGPLCGMGVCFECRVAIDGEEHCRSCQIVCRDGMSVTTFG
jgi:sarcosine oxidase subunit alpha